MTKSQSSPAGVKFNHNRPREYGPQDLIRFRQRDPVSSYVDEADLERSCAPEGYVAHALAVQS